MASRLSTRAFAFLSFVLLSQGCKEEPEPPAAAVEAELRAMLTTSDVADVLINLRDAEATNGSAMRELSASLIASAGPGLVVTRRFTSLPALAARISGDELERLARHPSVGSIQLESPGQLLVKEAVPAVGVDTVRSMYGLTGRGVRVAVLDSGVDVDHANLAGVVVAQRCFTRGGCGPFGSNEGSSAQDELGHGTSVANVLASRGVVGERGFAPEAELVAIKVQARGSRSVSSDWAAGLEWLSDNLSTLNVKVVSLGLGTNELHETEAACDREEGTLARAVKKLVDAGVVVFAAGGNQGSSRGLPAPACNTGVIAVGASYDSDVGKQPADVANFQRMTQSFAECSDGTTATNQIACFTNTSPLLDLIAPGAPIVADTLGGGTEQHIGTSMATTIASGVAALMLQCNPELTPDQIRDAMVSTGESRMAPNGGASFPSLRALEAIRAVCPGLDAGTAVPPTEPGSMPAGPGAGGASAADAGAGAPATGGRGSGERRGALLGERYTGGMAAPPLAASDSGTSDSDASDDLAGSAARGGGNANSTGGSASDDGCSCRVSAGARHSSSRWLWLQALVLSAYFVARRSRVRRARALPKRA